MLAGRPAASRDLGQSERAGFPILLGWYEKGRIAAGLPPGSDAAAAFWRAQVMAKPREPLQLAHWLEAIRWFLAWLEQARVAGGDGSSLEGRVRWAVDRTGARRGLAVAARRVYAGWAARFARWPANPVR